MAFVRDAVQWVARNAVRRAPAVDAFFESLDQVGKINALTDAIKSANDPARTLEELQARVSPESESAIKTTTSSVNMRRTERASATA
jgi:hypothetical protein